MGMPIAPTTTVATSPPMPLIPTTGFHPLDEDVVGVRELSARSDRMHHDVNHVRSGVGCGELSLAAVSAVPVLVSADVSAERFACARFIHNTGVRRPHPFVAVTCDAGHWDYSTWTDAVGRRGSPGLRAWIARASGGTLFIDSLEHMSLDLQTQLLDAFDHASTSAQPDPFADVRLITGARRHWSAQSSQRRFRERLFYRLNILRVEYAPVQTSYAGPRVPQVAAVLAETSAHAAAVVGSAKAWGE
jgi:transcriptional regulator of aromatic amino acid metabolism